MIRNFTLRIALFCLIIWAPLLKFVCLPDSLEYIKVMERRNPVEFPAHSGSPAKFPRAFESWFNDHFGFRRGLVTLNAVLHYYLMGVSANPDKVVLGKDDWLFLGNFFNANVDVYRGVNRFSEAELDKWARAFQERSDDLKAQGVDFLLVLVPNKETIYPENFPAWANVVDGKKRLDQAVERLARTEVNFLDLRDVLMKAKPKAPLYFKQDAHWNYYGAYLGYRSIMEKLGLPCLKEEDLHFRRVSWDGSEEDQASDKGLAKTLGMYEYFTDENVVYELNITKDILIKNGDGTILETGENKGYRQFDDRSFTNLHVESKRILFIRDSFTHSMSVYFNETLSESIYSDNMRYGRRKLESLINTFHPDVVVFQLLERYLTLPQTND